MRRSSHHSGDKEANSSGLKLMQRVDQKRGDRRVPSSATRPVTPGKCLQQELRVAVGGEGGTRRKASASDTRPCYHALLSRTFSEDPFSVFLTFMF